MQSIERLAPGFLLCVSTGVLLLFGYVAIQWSLTGMEAYGFQTIAPLVVLGAHTFWAPGGRHRAALVELRGYIAYELGIR